MIIIFENYLIQELCFKFLKFVACLVDEGE